MKKYYRSLNYLYRTLVSTEFLFGVKINGAQAIVRRGDEVLLIKTTYRPFWEFPGGKIEPREAPESAAIRETKEEARIFVKRIERKLGTYTDKHFMTTITVHVYVAAEWEELDLWQPTLEIGERQFFHIDNLPNDISPATRRRIGEMLSDSPREFSLEW